MTRDVVTISADATIQEAAQLLVERHVSAAPVVAASGNIVGIVSEEDLMRRPETGTLEPRSWWLQLLAGPEERATNYVKSHGRHVGDVMTKDVVTAGEDATIGDIAHLLEAHHVKRVPIVGDGQLVSIVARADLLRCLATHKEDMAPAISQDDRAIREALLTTLVEEDIAPRHLLNVNVTSGAVHLWGIVENEKQRDAIRVAAENIGGVKGVHSHLRVVPAWIWGQ